MVEATLWSLLVLLSMAGWGSLVSLGLFPSKRPDFGLRVVWGASALAFMGGLLAAASAYGRNVAMGLVDVGLIAGAWHVFRAKEPVRGLDVAWRAARRNPLLAFLGVGILVCVAFQFLGAVGDTTTNPYDDDVAYFPLVKRLIQTGTMIEPFSFRRLSALGGQLFYLSLLYPHCAFQNMNAFDRGIAYLGVVSLILATRIGSRRPPFWMTVLVLVFFSSLPVNSINTGSHFSGVLFFFGLFRTLQFLDEVERTRPGQTALWRQAFLPALVAAAACTLRQNFLAPAAMTLVASYGYRTFGSNERVVDRLKLPALAALIAAGALLPWFVLSIRSNGTPLFPLVLGTYNRSLVLTSNLFTWLDEARYMGAIAADNEPVLTVSLFVFAGVLLRDTGKSRPLRSLWVGTAAGFLILVHTLSQGDPPNLARYLFGFLTALVLATALTAGVTWSSAPTHARAQRAASILVLIAVGGQLFISRERLSRRYDRAVTAAKMHLHDAPASLKTTRPEFFLYAHAQSTLPEGAKVAVLLDEPYYLDFARNEVFNLDMPGYASLSPGLPYFRGAAAKADYFRRLGIRYLMFVTSDFSRVHYRREFWFQRMFTEEEIWRLYTPYQLDMIDSLAELKKGYRVLGEERGIVTLDLGEAVRE